MVAHGLAGQMDEVDRTGGSAIPAGFESGIETGKALSCFHAFLPSARIWTSCVLDRRGLLSRNRIIHTHSRRAPSPVKMDETLISQTFSNNFRNMEKTPLTTLAKARRAAVFFAPSPA
jgi:hypothetical protein